MAGEGGNEILSDDFRMPFIQPPELEIWSPVRCRRDLINFYSLVPYHDPHGISNKI